MTRQKRINELELLHNALMPALTKAAIGDFSTDITIDPRNPRQVNEVLAGVQVLLEVIREKMSELELTNAKLQESRDRSVSLLDEVLRKSLE